MTSPISKVGEEQRRKEGRSEVPAAAVGEEAGGCAYNPHFVSLEKIH